MEGFEERGGSLPCQGLNMKQEEKGGNTDIVVKKEKEERERELEKDEEGRRRDQKNIAHTLQLTANDRQDAPLAVPCREERTWSIDPRPAL